MFCLGHTMAEIVDVAIKQMSPTDVGRFISNQVFHISPTNNGVIMGKLFGTHVSDMWLNQITISQIIEAQDRWLADPLKCEWITKLKDSILPMVIFECPPCVSDAVWQSISDSERTQIRVTWNCARSATFSAQCLAAQLQARIDNGI